MRFVLLKRKMGFKDTISQGFIKQLAAHGLCEVSAHGIFKNHGIYPQFPRRKSCWVQLGTRLPGNQSHSRSRALRNPGLTMQEAGREINQQPFVNCFGFSCAGPGDFLLGKGKGFQTPLSADKAALLCLNPVILSTKAPLMLHLISLTWFSLGIPQITLSPNSMYIWSLGRNCVSFNPKPLEWEVFPRKWGFSTHHAPELFFTFKISLADSYFWLFPWKKKKKGLESALTCSKGSWSSCGSSPASPTHQRAK